jgi:ubiquinone/menaquinone biosynthesis C-methylase UbiE
MSLFPRCFRVTRRRQPPTRHKATLREPAPAHQMMPQMYRPFANQEFRNRLQTHLEIPAMLRLLSVGRGQRVLEVGCGRGVALPVLARLCAPTRLAGIDIDSELVELARARARRYGVPAELHVGDVREMPFDDAEFDVVIDFGTCYHIDGAESALREIDRVLCAGGLFIHESRLAQLIAHPIRTSFRAPPWDASLTPPVERHALLWVARRKSNVASAAHRREGSRHVHANP